MAAINIQTNRKEIEIQKDGVIVGSVFFSPGDPSIINRLNEVREKVKGIGMNIQEDDPVEVMLAEANRVDGELRTLIDYAFDYPCSDVVFGGGFSFSTANGVSQMEQFLDGAMAIINKEMTEEAKAAEKRQAKYLSKYK